MSDSRIVAMFVIQLAGMASFGRYLTLCQYNASCFALILDHDMIPAKFSHLGLLGEDLCMLICPDSSSTQESVMC